MQFIDEQHHPGIGIARFRKHGAQTLLELPPELRSRNQGPHIKGHEMQTLQRLRHFAGHNPLGQQLGDGGLADAWSADQHRIVLATTGQHLDQASDLRVAANDRIQGALGCRSRQITAVQLQSPRFLIVGLILDRRIDGLRIKTHGGRLCRPATAAAPGGGLGDLSRGDGVGWRGCREGLTGRRWGWDLLGASVHRRRDRSGRGRPL